MAEESGKRERNTVFVRQGATEYLKKRAGNMMSTGEKSPRHTERGQAETYFADGMRQLVEGRRAEAKKSFEKGAASPVFHWSPATRARAFADRMAKDPTWPDWLPATPVDSEAK